MNIQTFEKDFIKTPFDRCETLCEPCGKKTNRKTKHEY
ncbi:hypothetical protein J2Z29_002001 [Treponema pedis]